MNFGEKLKQLRQQQALSQPDLAEAAQIEQSYLSKLENGRSLPSQDVLNRLMLALNVTMDDLLDGIDDEEARLKLSNIPQVGAHIQMTASTQLQRQRTWLFTSLMLIGVGSAVLFAGAAALIFPDINFHYEYTSTDLVPLGDNGQRYDSIEDFVRYRVGERQEAGEPDEDTFLIQVAREERTLGDLIFPTYLLEDEFLGTRFQRDADANENAILQAAGFTLGGSRTFDLSDRHSLYRSENRYLIFLGWLLGWIGVASLAYTLLRNVIAKPKS